MDKIEIDPLLEEYENESSHSLGKQLSDYGIHASNSRPKAFA